MHACLAIHRNRVLTDSSVMSRCSRNDGMSVGKGSRSYILGASCTDCSHFVDGVDQFERNVPFFSYSNKSTPT